MTHEEITDFARGLFEVVDFLPLHRPILGDAEKEYLTLCVDSNFVSSVGEYVGIFEKRLADIAGTARAVATVNGTAALHIALVCSGVEPGSEVITQPLTFAATANAIAFAGATPVFVDVERETLGMDPDRLAEFLDIRTATRHGRVINVETGRPLSACVPVHVYGHPCRAEEIVTVCSEFGVPVVEDTAEALGSYRRGVHVGGHGLMSILSFNGNKIVTTGGGGAVLTNDEVLADRIKHLTTTAKRPHAYKFFHDEVGYNYRLPNLNAALGCAQLDQLDAFLRAKRRIAESYRAFFENDVIEYLDEPAGCRSNFWLNGILFENRKERDGFLGYSNANGVMSRPFWTLMNALPAFKDAPRMETPVSEDLYQRSVALPSSVPLGAEELNGGNA